MILSCLSIMMPLTKVRSLMQKTRMLLIFYSQESRPKQRQMLRCMLLRWKNSFLNSSLMKMRACFLSSFMITLTVIPFFVGSRGRFGTCQGRLFSLSKNFTFEEPYQAIKFATKEDVYKILGDQIPRLHRRRSG